MTGRSTCRLAMVQMRVDGGCPQANLARASERIAQAAQGGADVVVLPEAMDLGWTHPSARTAAAEIPAGAPCRGLQEAARRWGVYVCAGLTERSGSKVFNAAVLIDRSGQLILHHRKINELEIAHGLYDPGDRLLVADTELGTFGLMICADAFARGQVLSRALGLLGAQVILSPCAWAVESHHAQQRQPYGQLWLDSYQPVARDFRLWIAGVSSVGWLTAGPWEGRKCIGCSLLVDPQGQPAAVGPYGVDAEAILIHQMRLEARPTWGCGWEALWGTCGPQGAGVRHQSSSISSA